MGVNSVAVNNKAAAYIAYILLILITVTIAAFMIIWGQRTTEQYTEGTLQIASGRLGCRDIRIDAKPDDGCAFITLENKGMLNIEMARVTFDYNRPVDSELLPPMAISQANDPSPPFKTATILPVIKEDGNMFGCADKKLVVNCV
jgi:hypothetical protein